MLTCLHCCRYCLGMEIIAVTAILAVVLLSVGAMRVYAGLVEAAIRPQVDVAQVVRDVLDRFVEQSKSTNETITGVYGVSERAPDNSALLTALLGDSEPARMASFTDFDDSDPTDQFLKPFRSSATMIDGDDDNPFGVPGLVHVARKDDALSMADLIGAGSASW